MSTKYYTVTTKEHGPDWYTWILVVDDGIVVWSQAFDNRSKNWYTGIYQDMELSYVFDPLLFDLVEF